VHRKGAAHPAGDSLLTAVGGAETNFDFVTDGRCLTAAVAALGGAAGLSYWVPD
jgi:hypothetical protein